MKTKTTDPRELQKARFRKWRNENGLTIQAVADLMLCPVSTVIKWNDGANPSRLYQEDLKRTFGRSVSAWI